MASPIAEQCCYPSHCCAQRHMPECLSYSREHNNQLALFSTERCGHWKMSFWASCSGFNTAPPEALKGRITSKTSSTNRAGGKSWSQSLYSLLYSLPFLLASLYLPTTAKAPALPLQACWPTPVSLGFRSLSLSLGLYLWGANSVAGLEGYCSWGLRRCTSFSLLERMETLFKKCYPSDAGLSE